MIHLKKFYNDLTEFTLSTLHNFYWININNGKTNGKNVCDYFIKLLPTVIKIKNIMESEIMKIYDNNFFIDN